MLTIKPTLADPEPRDDADASVSRIGRPPFVPDPAHRLLVEALVAVGASQHAICRELVRLGCDCASITTLQRAFSNELAYGRERRMLGYAVKIHSIAMGSGPGAFTACRYLLSVFGGPQWRIPKDEADEPPMPDGETVHIYMPPNHRDEPEAEDEGPIIEGETGLI
jgi:hypothetical protein